MNAVLGLDTSCYTSSVALACGNDVYAQRRKLLVVEKGGRGLQQSQGVFQHVQNMPGLMEELMAEAIDARVTAVCASTRPRDREDSYMPVFTVGEGHGRALAAALCVPFIQTSHQQGHVRAAMVGAGLAQGEFIGLHLSGGTTEIFRCDDHLAVELLGGTSDLNAGQLIDRVGVALGLMFPAGKEMDELALAGESKQSVPTSLKDMACSLSGAEAQTMRMIEKKDKRPEDIAAEVFSFVARTVAKLIERAVKEAGIHQVLLAGGVASSRAIRAMLPERLNKLGCKVKLHWARPELSGDNAVGAALIGYDRIMGVNRYERDDH